MKEQDPVEESVKRREYVEDDEIDILDLIIPLLKRKWMIIFIVIVAGIAGAVYSFSHSVRVAETPLEAVVESPSELEPSVSRGYAALLGHSDNVSRLRAVVHSPEFAFYIMENHDQLMPLLFSDVWDSETNQWTSDRAPTTLEGYRVLQNMLESSIDGTILTVEVVTPDQGLSEELLTLYIESLASWQEHQRRGALDETIALRNAVEAEMNTATHPSLREKLAELAAQYVAREIQLRRQTGPDFTVIEAPSASEKPAFIAAAMLKTETKAQPKSKWKMMVVLSMMAGFFVAVFLAYVLEFAGNIKRRDPERYAELKRHIKPW